ncbi:response regulator [Desulfobacterales bacterium HSG17]|nr:response regulator [Desulfobacterales bacterium HSG17]
MKNNTKNKYVEEDISKLRKKAEKIFLEQQDDYPDPEKLSPAKTKSLINELRIRQIELEIQNKELRQERSFDKKDGRESDSFQAEERYRTFFENILSGIAVYEPDGEGNDFIIKDMNKLGEKLSKVRRRDIIGRKLTAIFPGIKEFGLLEVLQRVNITGKPEFAEAGIYEDDKHSPTWYENSVFKLPAGEIAAVYNDVSKRMNDANVLRESEKKYKSLFENSLMSVIQASVDGRIILANQKGAELFGYKNVNEFVNEFDPSKAYIGKQRADMLAQLKQEGFFTNREQQFLSKNGTSFWMLHSSCLDRESGIITSVGLDITAWKKTEKERERLHNIIEKSSFFISWADVEKNIKYINRAGRKMAGIAEEDDLTCQIIENFHTKKGFSVTQNTGIPHAIEKGFWEGESELLSHDGRIIPVSQTIISHYDEDGNIEYIATIIQDINNIKKKEQELKDAAAELFKHKQSLERTVKHRTADIRITNAKLKRANRLKDEFLANMSHELRTPLTSILGMSEALLEQVYGPVNEKQIKSLRRVKSSGNHLLNLINDILDLSKIEAGKMELNITQVSVHEICRASLQMVKETAQKKNQKLTLSIDIGLKYIYADILRLKQILVNLLMNAVKFTPEHGKIGFEVNCKPELEIVEFAVWDTGIGISEKDMKKLFKPFVQLDGSLTRKNDGTGLGLALVFKLADLHGGSVKVESEEDKCSRFSLMLPWHPDINLPGIEYQKDKETNKNKQTQEKYGNAAKHAKILMADDNISNIKTITDYLEAKSYDVMLAHDGSEAVKLAIKEKPDLILMDIQMPVMDGLEAIREIRKWEETGNIQIKIPIIALTALAMSGDREQCLEAGANEYMSKPVRLKDLIEMIDKLQVTASSKNPEEKNPIKPHRGGIFVENDKKTNKAPSGRHICSKTGKSMISGL